MHHQQTGPLQELDDKVPVRHDVHGIFPNGRETKFRAQEFPVKTIGISSKSGSAEGEDRDSWDDGRQSLEVRKETVRIGEEEMRPPDGLRSLKPYL